MSKHVPGPQQNLQRKGVLGRDTCSDGFTSIPEAAVWTTRGFHGDPGFSTIPLTEQLLFDSAVMGDSRLLTNA